MTEINGNFYETDSTRSFPAKVALYGNTQVHVVGDGFIREYRLSEVKMSRRIGNLTRTISFPDGCLFESEDNDAIDRYLETVGKHKLSRQVHTLERGWHWVAAAVLITIAAAWLFIAVGLPALASSVAHRLPPEVDDQLGRDGLALMDKWIFEPSELALARQTELQDRFAGLADHADIDRNLTLEFRSGGDIGPNAFALPSATIVMTDELVALAAHDKELAAVLAHEIGHVEGRHSLRLILQDSFVALMFAVVLGDVTSITGLAGALPALLVQNKFSRSFETEADDYALTLMEQAGIEPHYFGDILRRMEASHGSSDLPDFLSTHPATDQRTRRFDQ